MARSNKVKIDAELVGNFDSQLSRLEKFLRDIKSLGNGQTKIKIDSGDLNNVIKTLDRLEKGLKIDVKSLEKEEIKLKLDVEDIKNQLKDVKIEVEPDGLERLERLMSGSVNLNIDFSPLSQLENRLSDLFRELNNTLSGGGVGSADGGGLNSLAVAGGVALANRYSSVDESGNGGAGLGKAGLIGGTLVALGSTVASGAELNSLYKQIYQSVGNDDALANKIYGSALESFSSGVVKDLPGLGYVSSTLGKLDNVSNLSSKDLTNIINTSYMWERNHGVDVDELFITLNSLMAKEGNKKGYDYNYYLDLMNVGLSSGANQLNKDFMPSSYEFISQAEMSGIEYKDMVKTFISNVKEGGWNQDGVGNAYLEFNNSMSELATMSNDSDAMDIRNALNDIGVNWEEIRTGFKAGGEEGRQALFKVLQGLKDVDETTRRMAGTELFGTVSEDHMDALINSMLAAQDVALDFDGSNVAAVASETESVYTKVEGIKNSVKLISGSIGEIVVTLGDPAISLLADGLSFAAEKGIVLADVIGELHERTEGFSTPLGVLKSSFEIMGDIIEGIDEDTGFIESTWDVFGKKLSAITDTAKELWGYVKNIAGGFGEGITDLASNPLDFIKENDFTRKLFSIDTPKPSETKSSGEWKYYGGALNNLTLNADLKMPKNGLYTNVSSYNKIINGSTFN